MFLLVEPPALYLRLAFVLKIVLSSDTPFRRSPHREVVVGSLAVVVALSLLLITLLSSLLDGGLSITVGVSVVVLRPASRSDRGGVLPDVVLGFVHGSAVEELLLDVPEVESISPDGLEDDSEEAKKHLYDRDVHGVVVGGVREDSVLGVPPGDGNEPEDLEEPEEGNVVPGVDVGPDVESVKDRKVSGVRSKPHPEEGEGSDSCHDDVEQSTGGLPGLKLEIVNKVPGSEKHNVN